MMGAARYGPPMTERVVCFSVSHSTRTVVGTSRHCPATIGVSHCVASELLARGRVPHHVRRGMIVRVACDDTQSWLRCFFTWVGW